MTDFAPLRRDLLITLAALALLLCWEASGLDMVLLETEMADKIDEAVLRGVRILACENTMIGRNLTRADMYPSVGYVKTGVAQLMKRQREGWAYIRP